MQRGIRTANAGQSASGNMKYIQRCCVYLLLEICIGTTLVHMAYGIDCIATEDSDGQMQDSSLPTHLLNCNFSNTLCCYMQGPKNDMSNWTITAGGASANQTNKHPERINSSISQLESPLLNFTQISCVEFTYRSNAPSELKLLLLVDGNLKLVFEGADVDYQTVFRTIPEGTRKLIFEAFGRGGAAVGPSDVSLKAVDVHLGNCTGPECGFELTLCGWQGNGWDRVQDADTPHDTGSLTTNLVRAAADEGCLHFDFYMDETETSLSVILVGMNRDMQLLWRLAAHDDLRNIWRNASVPIQRDSAFKVMFEARRCSSETSQIKLDSVVLRREENDCHVSPPEATADGSKVLDDCGRRVKTTPSATTAATHSTTGTTATTTITTTATVTAGVTATAATTTTTTSSTTRTTATSSATTTATITAIATTTIPSTPDTDGSATVAATDSSPITSTDNVISSATTSTGTETTATAGTNVPLIVGSVVAAVVVLLIVIFIILWRKKVICTERGFYAKFRKTIVSSRQRATTRNMEEAKLDNDDMNTTYGTDNPAFIMDTTDDDVQENLYAAVAEDGAPGITRHTSNTDYSRLQRHTTGYKLPRDPGRPEDDYSHLVVSRSQTTNSPPPVVVELHENVEQKAGDVDTDTDALYEEALMPSSSIMNRNDSAGGLSPDRPTIDVDLYSVVGNMDHTIAEVVAPKADEAFLSSALLENGYSQVSTQPAVLKSSFSPGRDPHSEAQDLASEGEGAREVSAEKSVRFILPSENDLIEPEDVHRDQLDPKAHDARQPHSQVYETESVTATEVSKETRDNALDSQAHEGKGIAAEQRLDEDDEAYLYSTVDKSRKKPPIPPKPSVVNERDQGKDQYN